MRRNRVAMLLTVTAGAGAATFVNWPGYLIGPAHTSDNQAATAITPATVPALTQAWNWVPPSRR